MISALRVGSAPLAGANMRAIEEVEKVALAPPGQARASFLFRPPELIARRVPCVEVEKRPLVP